MKSKGFNHTDLCVLSQTRDIISSKWLNLSKCWCRLWKGITVGQLHEVHVRITWDENACKPDTGSRGSISIGEWENNSSLAQGMPWTATLPFDSFYLSILLITSFMKLNNPFNLPGLFDLLTLTASSKIKPTWIESFYREEPGQGGRMEQKTGMI